jgi:hypothetical protein
MKLPLSVLAMGIHGMTESIYLQTLSSSLSEVHPQKHEIKCDIQYHPTATSFLSNELILIPVSAANHFDCIIDSLLPYGGAFIYLSDLLSGDYCELKMLDLIELN